MLLKKALELHKKFRGKIEIAVKVPVKTEKDLALVYTPGVAEVSKEIAKCREKVFDYTAKWNTIAIVTDGSRVLGLGNIGAEAALPVMEGKSALFKEYGDVDAIPICLSTQDTEKIIETIKYISPVFGGINLEDIDSPKVFEIREKLKSELDIPIFHDDRDGTSIVVLAALINALKIVGKRLNEISVAIAGAGSAGFGITEILLKAGVKNIIVTDSKGIIYRGRKEGMNKYKEELARTTNPENKSGTLEEAMKNSDVFIGVSAISNLINKEMIRKMSSDAIVFALSNPDPEILPDEALDAGARIVATGRSDFPNQVNNLLIFPGIFRGILDVREKEITDNAKIAVANAIAGLVDENKLNEDYILPKVTDKNVAREVAKVVREFARK